MYCQSSKVPLLGVAVMAQLTPLHIIWDISSHFNNEGFPATSSLCYSLKKHHKNWSWRLRVNPISKTYDTCWVTCTLCNLLNVEKLYNKVHHLVLFWCISYVPQCEAFMLLMLIYMHTCLQDTQSYACVVLCYIYIHVHVERTHRHTHRHTRTYAHTESKHASPPPPYPWPPTQRNWDTRTSHRHSELAWANPPAEEPVPHVGQSMPHGWWHEP